MRSRARTPGRERVDLRALHSASVACLPSCCQTGLGLPYPTYLIAYPILSRWTCAPQRVSRLPAPALPSCAAQPAARSWHNCQQASTRGCAPGTAPPRARTPLGARPPAGARPACFSASARGPHAAPPAPAALGRAREARVVGTQGLGTAHAGAGSGCVKCVRPGTEQTVWQQAELPCTACSLLDRLHYMLNAEVRYQVRRMDQRVLLPRAVAHLGVRPGRGGDAVVVLPAGHARAHLRDDARACAKGKR